MPYSNDAKHTMLANLVGKTTPDTPVTQLGLHSALPDGTGSNEVTGGGYARIAVTEADFDAPAVGEVELNNDKTFAGPADSAVTHFSIWGAGDLFLGSGAIVGDNNFNAEGEFILQLGTSLDLNA